MLSSEYIAGLFDGEGYVTLHGRKDGYIMCYVGIVMQDTRVLDLLLQQFPESVIYGHDKNNKLSNGNCSSWRLNSKSAKVFVDTILPYCILKQEDLQWYLDWYNLSRNTTNKLTEQTKVERTKFVEAYKAWRATRKG